MLKPRLRVDSLPDLIDAFRRDLKRRGRAPDTIAIYMWSAQSLVSLAAAHRKGGLGYVDRDLLERWQDSLSAHLIPRSEELARVGVRRLLKWAADRELCSPLLERVVVGIKVVRKRPRPLAPWDLIRIQSHLLERCDPELAAFFGHRPPTVHDLRDRALFHYIIATAGRVSEILQVRRPTFERQIVRQKGGGEKEFICPPGVARLIHQYLTARTDNNPYLWIAFKTDHTIAPLRQAGVLAIWARLARRYHLEPFTTHQLRHTSATKLSASGHDALAIANHLGHADLRSVPLYTAPSASRQQLARADLDVAF